MSREIASKNTPLTEEQAVASLWKGYLRYFGTAPTPKCIEIVASQWGLETGWGDSMFCNNYGNVKAYEGDGFDYQYFPCNELLPSNLVDEYVGKDPSKAKIQSYRGDGYAWVWFYPNHPACRFRAFEDADAGAADHIGLLAKHFPAALKAARLGDPVMYAHALKLANYYTADESKYAEGLVGCVRAVQGLPINFDTLPALSDAQLEQLDDWLAVSLDLGVQDALEEADRARREANQED